MRSLSEIDTTSKRATRAAGYSWGVAEEVGKNIRILELFGLPGIKNLNSFLKEKKNFKLENLKLINENNKNNLNQFCPIIAGVSFLDQIVNLQDLTEIKFQKISYPLLFLPFVSRASEVLGKKLLLQFDKNQFLLNFNTSIYSNFLNNEIVNQSETVSIKIIDNKDLFSANEWKELYKLSENTFVDENESLKQSGAGAGLTDND